NRVSRQHTQAATVARHVVFQGNLHGKIGYKSFRWVNRIGHLPGSPSAAPFKLLLRCPFLAMNFYSPGTLSNRQENLSHSFPVNCRLLVWCPRSSRYSSLGGGGFSPHVCGLESIGLQPLKLRHFYRLLTGQHTRQSNFTRAKDEIFQLHF